MATVYLYQEKFEKAKKLSNEAIKIHEKTIGVNNPDYAQNLGNLASAYKSQGKYNESVELYEKAIGIIENTFGKKHLSYTVKLYNLATLYFEQEKYQKAFYLYEEAYKITQKLLGENHSETKNIKEQIIICQIKIREKVSLLVPYKIRSQKMDN